MTHYATRRYSRAEKVFAWAAVAVFVGGSVTLLWLLGGAVWGLALLVAIAGATAWAAATDNLIQREPDEDR